MAKKKAKKKESQVKYDWYIIILALIVLIALLIQLSYNLQSKEAGAPDGFYFRDKDADSISDTGENPFKFKLSGEGWVPEYHAIPMDWYVYCGAASVNMAYDGRCYHFRNNENHDVTCYASPDSSDFEYELGMLVARVGDCPYYAITNCDTMMCGAFEESYVPTTPTPEPTPEPTHSCTNEWVTKTLTIPPYEYTWVPPESYADLNCPETVFLEADDDHLVLHTESDENQLCHYRAVEEVCSLIEPEPTPCVPEEVEICEEIEVRKSTTISGTAVALVFDKPDFTCELGVIVRADTSETVVLISEEPLKCYWTGIAYQCHIEERGCGGDGQ